MAVHKDDAMFAECKWQNADIGIEIYNELKRKSELFSYKNAYLYIFAKKKFSEKLLRLEREHELVRLLSLSEMIDLAGQRKGSGESNESEYSVSGSKSRSAILNRKAALSE